MIEAPRRLRPGLVALLLLLPACGTDAPIQDLPRGTLVIRTEQDQVSITVSIAETDEAMARGLMGVESMDPDVGMVFLPEEPRTSSFHMKDTLIPLSVAFWGADRRLFRILDMEPCRQEPCPSYDPGASWSGAVEVNLGFFDDHGVRVGHPVRLER